MAILRVVAATSSMVIGPTFDDSAHAPNSAVRSATAMINSVSSILRERGGAMESSAGLLVGKRLAAV
nr:hypothetical protein GCM10020063_010010 [Dactylosporangium thailandense]